MLAILLPLVIINTEVTNILFALLAMFMSFVGTYEFISKAFNERKELRLFKIIVPIFSSILTFLTLNFTSIFSGEVLIIEMSLVKSLTSIFLTYITSIVIICGICLFIPNSKGNDVLTCIGALSYVGLMLSSALAIRFLKPTKINETIINLDGTKAFLFVYTIVLLTDSFAYLFGKAYGKNKLCPEISPNKTKEGALAGLIGGAIFGVIGAYVYQIVPDFDNALIIIPIVFGISLIISCMVQMGDLVESKFKRTYEVKDFGNLLPGHGGILDRFDSLLYSGTMFYIIIIFMELIIFG